MLTNEPHSSGTTTTPFDEIPLHDESGEPLPAATRFALELLQVLEDETFQPDLKRNKAHQLVDKFLDDPTSFDGEQDELVEESHRLQGHRSGRQRGGNRREADVLESSFFKHGTPGGLSPRVAKDDVSRLLSGRGLPTD